MAELSFAITSWACFGPTGHPERNVDFRNRPRPWSGSRAQPPRVFAITAKALILPPRKNGSVCDASAQNRSICWRPNPASRERRRDRHELEAGSGFALEIDQQRCAALPAPIVRRRRFVGWPSARRSTPCVVGRKAFFPTIRSGASVTSASGSKSVSRSNESYRMRRSRRDSSSCETERVAVGRAWAAGGTDGCAGAGHVLDDDRLTSDVFIRSPRMRASVSAGHRPGTVRSS